MNCWLLQQRYAFSFPRRLRSNCLSIAALHADLCCADSDIWGAFLRSVTVNMGMSMPSWFDINSLDPRLFRRNPPGLAQSAEYVRELIKEYRHGLSLFDFPEKGAKKNLSRLPGREEQLDDGIRPKRVVLAGFSQGGAVVLEALDRHDIS